MERDAWFVTYSIFFSTIQMRGRLKWHLQTPAHHSSEVKHVSSSRSTNFLCMWKQYLREMPREVQQNGSEIFSTFLTTTHSEMNFCQRSCLVDTVLEETLSDIDEFIQSELGFAPLIVTEPLTAAELHELSSLLQTRESSNGSLLRSTSG